MNSKLHKGVASAVAVVSFAISDKAESTMSSVNISLSDDVQTSFTYDAMPSLESNSVGAAMTPFFAPPPIERWAPKYSEHFMSLVEKHCLQEATPAEELELEKLQRLKGIYEDPRTADEMLAEWKFRKKVDQILELLRQTAIHDTAQTKRQNRPRTSA